MKSISTNTHKHPHRTFPSWALAFALLFIVGCTSASPTFVPQQIPTATTVPIQTPVPAPTEIPTPLPVMPKPGDKAEQPAPEQPEVVQLAISALADMLRIDADEIAVQEVAPVEWNDASLGCPQPGMMYAQVITPGYRVVLAVDGKSYEYHTDRKQAAALCVTKTENTDTGEEETVTDETAVPTPQNPYLQNIVIAAKEDLADRLSISVDQVDLLEVHEVTWSDASLGCPQPGMHYAQVLQDGLLIRLSAKGQEYEYHSGGSSEPFLCEQPAKSLPDIGSKPIEILPPPGSEND